MLADLRDADLSGANLIGANLSLAKLNRADLTDADLTDANLSGADLIGAILSGANFSGANFRNADLKDANLNGVGFSTPKLNDVLIFQNISQNVSNQQNYVKNFDFAYIRRANRAHTALSGADLTEVKELTVEQIKTAKNWETAKYDPEFRSLLGLLAETPQKPGADIQK
ncbi:MAG: pentapeptide repeat-containing protein [Calothrix sp. FI2-JRJ7]|nr:pentapeptide repeat-containing protein [Calothrix sp. FI2-JRJ7]